MSVPYPAGTSGAEAPLTVLYTVTPNDDEDLPFVPRALILSDAATVRMEMLGGGAAIDVPLQAGFNPLRPRRIHATGTGSTAIVAGY
jgi:hypothetical protein